MLASTFTKTPVAFGLARLMSSMPEFEFVKVERKGTDGRVGLVTLNRPKALNALFNPLMDDLIAALNHFDNDKTVGAMVLTGKLKFLLSFETTIYKETRAFLINKTALRSTLDRKRLQNSKMGDLNK